MIVDLEKYVTLFCFGGVFFVQFYYNICLYSVIPVCTIYNIFKDHQEFFKNS